MIVVHSNMTSIRAAPLDCRVEQLFEDPVVCLYGFRHLSGFPTFVFLTRST